MSKKVYPLEAESVGEDTYIVMSRGHHNLDEFMRIAVDSWPSWALGGPHHTWIKTTPGCGSYDVLYHHVPEGTRGAFPATYCYEYGENWKEYNQKEKH